MRTITQCKKCKKYLGLGDGFVEIRVGKETTALLNAELFEINATQETKDDIKRFFLSGFECPYCNEKHIVEIDDKKTKMIDDKIKKLFRVKHNRQKIGKEVTKHMSNKLKNYLKELDFERARLKAETLNKITKMYFDDGKKTEFLNYVKLEENIIEGEER